ncbi:hypothetical protein C823_004542 [Eubacterium plexicaudatum ASF492]|nr:hypothetical protein C823_004542 [Eubacterium plexicaudatum ASF492]
MKKSSLKDTIPCMNSIEVSCCVNNPVRTARRSSEKANTMVPDSAMANAFGRHISNFPFC